MKFVAEEILTSFSLLDSWKHGTAQLPTSSKTVWSSEGEHFCLGSDPGSRFLEVGFEQGTAAVLNLFG